MMQSKHPIAASAIAFLLGAGCSTSSSQCPGGTLINETCVLGPFPCADGTKRNPETNACELDPASCRAGTVLINHSCVDPTAGLTVDLEEAAEPNGLVEFKYQWETGPFTVLEPNWQSAGSIALKPPGDPGVVIHGCVVPTADRAADFDAYTFTVDRPTLLHVSVDGVNGLSAGFFFVADQDPPPADLTVRNDQALWHDLFPHSIIYNWLRVGLSTVSDSSQREVYLPLAGRYRMFVTDSRTLVPLTQAWSDRAVWQHTPVPAGNLDGSGCYYVTVEQRNVPSPTPLDFHTGDSGTIRGDVKFYTSANFGEGFTGVSAAIDSVDAKVSLMLFNNGALRQVTNELDSVTPAAEKPGQLIFGGIKPGDTPLLVLDHRYAFGEPDYNVGVYAQIPAQPLPSTGETIVSALKGNMAVTYPPPNFLPTVNPRAVNLFYFDVVGSRQLIGMKLRVSLPVQGDIYDEDLHPAAAFSELNWGTSTFTDYQGLIRTIAPGRYYFWLYGPRNTVGDAFSVTSTYTPITPAPTIAVDAPSGPIRLDPTFASTMVTYDPGPDATWQWFNATGTDMTNVVATVLEPGMAYGRLDKLELTKEADPPAFDEPTWLGLRTFSFPEDGSAPAGHVVFGKPNPLWVKVNASAPGPNPTFNLNFTTRQLSRNFNWTEPPFTATLTGETLTAVAPNDQRRYFFRAPTYSIVTITATPTSGFRTAARRLMIATVNRDESDNVIFDTPIAGPEVARFRLPPPPEVVPDFRISYTGFVVRAAQPSAGTYNLTVKIDPPYYSAHPSTTSFSDACAGGNVVAMTADGSVDDFGNVRRADDQGLSAPIATPAGFQFYGASVANLVVSTNGFVSFDPTITSSDVSNTIGKANIAPFGQDLFGMTICTKAVGSSRIIQWSGFAETKPVQFQLILNGTDQSIEFVFGPKHTSLKQIDELFGAFEGVQDTAGIDSTLVLGSVFGAIYPDPSTAVRLTHP